MSIHNPSTQVWKGYEDAAVVEVVAAGSNVYKELFSLKNARLLHLAIYQVNDESAQKNVTIKLTIDNRTLESDATACNDSAYFSVFQSFTALGDNAAKELLSMGSNAHYPLMGMADGTPIGLGFMSTEGHTITFSAKTSADGTNQKFYYRRVYELLEVV